MPYGFVADSTLQWVYQALCAEPYHLPYFATFQFVETRTSNIMQFNHIVAVVLDLLYSNHYVPKAVIIHTRHCDFGVMPQHLVKFYMAQMVNTVTELICKAQPFRHCHIGTFTSLMLPDQYYIGWSTQKAAHRARACYNGCLARAAMLVGHYIISHLELSPQDHPAFLELGKTTLSRTGNLIFMADVQAAIRKWTQVLPTTLIISLNT